MTARALTGKRSTLNRNLVPVLTMISPVTLWLVILVAVPLIYVLVMSFCSTDANHDVVLSFTLRNYMKLFDPTMLQIYSNSLMVAGLTTAVCVLLSYPFAWIMASVSPFRKTMMMILLMLPFWTNCILRLYGWRTLIGTNGYINVILMKFSIINEPLEMLYTRGAIVLGMVYVLLPFMVLPIFTVIDKLDRSLLEAASDLGARPFRRFIHVMLPLTSPGIFSGVIMVFIPSLGYFFVSDMLGGGKSQLIGNVVQRQFKDAFNWPFGAALSIILIIITLILVRLYTRTGGSLRDFEGMK
jgi:spermidine/putrescine transport system permease protein